MGGWVVIEKYLSHELYLLIEQASDTASKDLAKNCEKLKIQKQ